MAVAHLGLVRPFRHSVVKLCPGCSNLIPPNAMRCECGFAFSELQTKRPRAGSERTSRSDPQTPTSNDATRKQTMFWLLSLYMICIFLWRAVTPGGEYPRPPTRFITIAIDLLCVGILLRLKVRLSAEKKPDKRLSTGGSVLFWIALVAGLGVLAIRWHGDDSWATGHFFQ